MEKLGLRRESVRTGGQHGRNGEPIETVVYGLDLPAAGDVRP
jgi:hypothetical protein